MTRLLPHRLDRWPACHTSGEPGDRRRAARKRLADVARAWQTSATRPDVDRCTSTPPC